MTAPVDPVLRARKVVLDVEWQTDNFLPAKGETGPACKERRLIETMAEAFAELTSEAESRARREAYTECAEIALQWRDENKRAAEQERRTGTQSMADRLDGSATECNAFATAITKWRDG